MASLNGWSLWWPLRVVSYNGKWLDRTSIAQEMRGNRVVVCSCRSHGVWFFWASCPNKDGKDLLVYQISRQIIFVSSLLPYNFRSIDGSCGTMYLGRKLLIYASHRPSPGGHGLYFQRL